LSGWDIFVMNFPNFFSIWIVILIFSILIFHPKRKTIHVIGRNKHRHRPYTR